MTSLNPYPTLSKADNTNLNIPSLDYFSQLKVNLPDNLSHRIPSNLTHIWSKSAIILTMDMVYCKCDYLINPPNEWQTEDFNSALKQIVHEFRGFNYDHYIILDEPVTNFNILEALNYKVTRLNTTMNSKNEQIFWIDGIHELDGDEITLHFKF